MLEDEEEVYYIERADGKVKFEPAQAPPAAASGLGTWIIDFKSKKRKYVDLTGRELLGMDAYRQAKLDKESEGSLHHARKELRRLMEAVDTNPLDSDPALQLLSTWGLPPTVIAKYANRGVTTLFQWQVDCLLVNDGKVLRGGNLIYSAPTSGGKTLIAELLMLRRIGLNGRGVVLFVVPFVALAEQTTRHCREMFSDVPLGVRAFHGDNQGARVTPDLDVGVCTIERANIILSQLLEEGQEKLITMVVIDEIHMLQLFQSLGKRASLQMCQRRWVPHDTQRLRGLRV